MGYFPFSVLELGGLNLHRSVRAVVLYCGPVAAYILAPDFVLGAAVPFIP